MRRTGRTTADAVRSVSSRTGGSKLVVHYANLQAREHDEAHMIGRRAEQTRMAR